MYDERNFKTPRSLRDLFILSLMCLEKGEVGEWL